MKPTSPAADLPADAPSVYEDWRAQWISERTCPALAALRRAGLLEALLTVRPEPAGSAPPVAAPPCDRNELVGAVAALLRGRPPRRNQP